MLDSTECAPWQVQSDAVSQDRVFVPMLIYHLVVFPKGAIILLRKRI